jgi:FlaA1/EpsC-like NDP-sugar epimerase
MFKNKKILITGGTGSFGSSVLSRLLKEKLHEIRIFSRDEKKQDDLRKKITDKRVKFYIGDVRNFDSLDEAVCGVDYIFHAAALKQVPTCEYFPQEAIMTNIMGANNLIKSSIKNSVKKVIFLSTDKAVYPINAMGMSKALMEKLVLANCRKKSNSTVFCITRYGNVMLSRGSVIPLFLDQIKNNKSITITDPSMTRFLMTLNDSVQLVLHALKYGKSGDIFVLKSSSSTILNLANALKKIFRSKVIIKSIGTRLGEKKHETLVSKEEMFFAEQIKNYIRIPLMNNDLNYRPYFTEGNKVLSEIKEYTSENTKVLTEHEVVNLLSKIDLNKFHD